MDIQDPAKSQDARKKWMALLGSADPKILESARNGLDLPFTPTYIVKPETGMLMAQARADVAGARFNLGEVTVTRCIMDLEGRATGYAMVLGSDARHAELAALLDGLLQMPEYGPGLLDSLITPLRDRRERREQSLARDRAATRVD